MQADEFGIKLEIVQGTYTWEFFPSPFHQGAVQRVQQSIRTKPGGVEGCGCFSIQDIYIRFPDGSIKRPDLSIFCKEPELTRQALTLVPDAVVEIVSPGGEKKDLDVGPSFYLSQGVKDVVVSNPDSLGVFRLRIDLADKESDRQAGDGSDGGSALGR